MTLSSVLVTIGILLIIYGLLMLVQHKNARPRYEVHIVNFIYMILILIYLSRENGSYNGAILSFMFVTIFSICSVYYSRNDYTIFNLTIDEVDTIVTQVLLDSSISFEKTNGSYILGDDNKTICVKKSGFPLVIKLKEIKSTDLSRRILMSLNQYTLRVSIIYRHSNFIIMIGSLLTMFGFNLH